MDPLKEKKAERERARTDRMFLACDVLGYDFTAETHQELFDQYPPFKEDVEWASQFGGKDVLVLWPRGHFKSTAVVVLCVQAILVNPDIRILLMQGTIKVTKGLLAEIASHFTGMHSRTRLPDLFPEFCGDKKAMRLTADRFTTPARKREQLQQATCTVASPRSIKTGQHYDAGFFDDLVNDSNYRNPVLLVKIEEDFNMARPLVDPGCPRFVSGTRYAFGDMYENIIRRNKGEWQISVKTCWREDGITPRFPQYRTKDGRLVGLTRAMLLQIASDSPQIFASQYLNYPIASSMQVLPEELLMNAVVVPDEAPPLSQAVLFIDLAAEGDAPDDSVVLAAKTDAQGRPFVVDMGGGIFPVAGLAVLVINQVIKWRPLKVMVEKTASAQYFVAYLNTVARSRRVTIPIDYIKVDNRADAKNIRVQAMAGHIKAKRMFFFAGLPCWEKFVEQAKQFPKGKHGHDDWPDTAALCCQFFQNRYTGPVMPETKNRMIRMLERELERDPISQLIPAELSTQWGDCGGEYSSQFAPGQMSSE